MPKRRCRKSAVAIIVKEKSAIRLVQRLACDAVSVAASCILACRFPLCDSCVEHSRRIGPNVAARNRGTSRISRRINAVPKRVPLQSNWNRLLPRDISRSLAAILTALMLAAGGGQAHAQYYDRDPLPEREQGNDTLPPVDEALEDA